MSFYVRVLLINFGDGSGLHRGVYTFKLFNINQILVSAK